jgi:uncharacterized membrane protein
MGKGRLEAFSDGVIAIIITIMVLELKVPHGTEWSVLTPLIPVFLSYVLSFVFIGIYWNNHHHMLQAIHQVNGKILWANLQWLFWMSLVPFVTGWMGENHFESLPTALYGFVLLMTGFAYLLLARLLADYQGKDSTLALALGRDYKGKSSLAAYAIAIPLSFLKPWIAFTIFVGVAVMWFIPDPRIEKRVME